MSRPRTRPYSPAEITELAELSRTYQKRHAHIRAAIMQQVLDGEDPREIAERFAVPRHELARYLPQEVRAVRHGYIHRADLRSTEEVLGAVSLHIELGLLKPGEQLPARPVFTQVYRCDKRTHAEVVKRLMERGYIHRPGGRNSALYVAPLEWQVGSGRG